MKESENRVIKVLSNKLIRNDLLESQFMKLVV